MQAVGKLYGWPGWPDGGAEVVGAEVSSEKKEEPGGGEETIMKLTNRFQKRL